MKISTLQALREFVAKQTHSAPYSAARLLEALDEEIAEMEADERRRAEPRCSCDTAIRDEEFDPGCPLHGDAARAGRR